MSVLLKMNSIEREELREVILGEIESQKQQIESLSKSVKPIAPDNSIGRLTRMEAIESKGVSEASLSSAQRKLAGLETALVRLTAKLRRPTPFNKNYFFNDMGL